MNKRGHIKIANSASCGDFSHLRKARFLDEPYVLSSSLASHKCKNSSTIPEFAFCKNAEFDSQPTNLAQDTRIANALKKFASCKNAESSDKIKSKKPLKSFCYFWLLPKVESPLSFNHNLPNKVDLQNLIENQVKSAESANKTQQTIEEIAVEVAEFLGDFQGNFVLSDKARLKSAQCSKFPKSPQDAPKTKLQTQDKLT